MKMSADGAWYFSRDGQQSGPLAYSDLKEKADEGVLKPRSDLVWKEGMADWMPIGEIDGLFERQEVPAPPLTLDAAAVESVLTDRSPQASLGQFGGCRRRSYLFFQYLAPCLAVYLFSFANRTYPEVLAPQVWDQVQRYGPLLLVAFILYVSIQRFANLGMSRWWFLGHFVPILNLWTRYRSFACPEGYAQHKKMDAAGIFLAITYWLVVIAALAAFVLIIMILGGKAGSPEIQQQLKDLLETFRTNIESIVK